MISPEDFYKSLTEGNCVNARPRVSFWSPQAPHLHSRQIEIPHSLCIGVLLKDLGALKDILALVDPVLLDVDVVATIACACGNKTQVKL